MYNVYWCYEDYAQMKIIIFSDLFIYALYLCISLNYAYVFKHEYFHQEKELAI